jgi:hypothetical protein
MAPRILSPDRFWEYGLAELKYGDEPAALGALEQALDLNAARWPAKDRAQFMRDLAEVSLAQGKTDEAQQAATMALDALSQMDLTATFTPSERDAQAQVTRAILLAGRGDAAALEALAREPSQPLIADPWYLLGWLRERNGDRAGARAAYTSYLQLVPAYGLLRRTQTMRAHAADVLRG